jgi:hypothetical protein
MKRVSLIAMLLLGGTLNPHADNDVHDNITGQPRGHDVLRADTDYGSQMPGAPQIGGITGSSCSNFKSVWATLPCKASRDDHPA